MMKGTESAEPIEWTEPNVRDSSYCVFLDTKHRMVPLRTNVTYAFSSIHDVTTPGIVPDDQEPIDKQVDSCAEWIASRADKRIVLGMGYHTKANAPVPTICPIT